MDPLAAVLDIELDTTTPHGDFMVNMMASVAQLERKIIGQRTRDALAVKRAHSVRLGRPSKVDAGIVAWIVVENREGSSLSAMARALNEDGIPTAHGGARWYLRQ